MKSLIRFLGLACLTAIIGTSLSAQVLTGLSPDDLTAIESTTPTPADAIPFGVTYYSAQNFYNWPAMPGNPLNLPGWLIGKDTWLLDDLNTDYSAPRGGLGMRSMAMGSSFSLGMAMEEGSFGALGFDTNQLFLEITNVSNGLAYLNLHNATNKVYAVWSVTNLSTGWNVETELMPIGGQTNIMPFTVSTLGRQNLFLRAMDWTGITHGGNTTPDWWFWKYFGTTDLADINLDSLNNTLRYDYTNGLDPNIIQFSLQFTNNYIQSSPAYGTVTIQQGMPSYIAVLINDTNQADAIWQPYTSTNIAIALNSGNGLYNIQVGLRGLPPDARQSWDSAQLSLNNIPPVFSLTTPMTSTVSIPLIQLQGFVSASLSSLTYDISNASGVVSNQTGYWQPSFYDTNLLDFTTNTFQCYDIPLTNGLNIITLHAADVFGNSTTTNFNYTLDYSGDTNAPMLSLIWPTNGTSIAGSNFTIQAQIDDVTATVMAQIVDTNSDTNTVQGLVERSGVVWFNNLPLNGGTNAVTITATDAAGNVSTTNLNIIQSSANFTINPLSSSQMNQTNVTIIGTIDNPSDKIVINGVSAVINGNTWTATNVPVNDLGTASLNAQVSDANNNPLVAQTVYQPQPAKIVAASYKNQTDYTYQTVSFVCGWTTTTWPPVWTWTCAYGYNMGMQSVAAYWSYAGGGLWHYHYIPYDKEGTEPSDSLTPLVPGENGLSTAWENVNTQSHFEGETVVSLNNSEQITSYSYNHTQTHVMIEPSGQQQIGQTALYLVQAQVTNEDTGLRLLASAVRFMNQLAGTTTEDVTNDDGSVWSQAIVSSPAGVPVEITPTTPGNINFSQMKLSPTKIIYFRIADNGNVPSSFRNKASAVESKLYSELAANVFYNLTTDTDVRIKVGIGSTPPGNPGWDGSAKQSYINQVNFGWNNLQYNENFAENDHHGTVNINLNWYIVQNINVNNVTAQGWVDMFAHEGIWGNVAAKNDCIIFCTDYEISSKNQSYDDSNPFTVSSSSRSTILNACGLKSN